MNRQEYMDQLKERLKRLPKADYERAVEYFEEYFADAGEENEARAVEDLGSPQEAADQIIRDMALNYSKEPVRDVRGGMNALWVVLLALCAAPVALPLAFAGVLVFAAMILVIWSLLLCLLLAAVCAVITGPVTAIAGFTVITKSIPIFLSCVGIGMMFTGIGAASAYGMYLLCKRFMGWTVKGLAKMIRKGDRKNA